jgi:DNA-binding response OmpR family regulator
MPLRRSSSIALLIDPDASASATVRDLLQHHYPTTAVTSFAAAREIIEQFHPQFVLIEPHIADEDGLAFIAELHAMPIEVRPIVVCVTLARTVREKVAAFHAGADDYLVKPINPATFVTRLVLLHRMRQYAHIA